MSGNIGTIEDENGLLFKINEDTIQVEKRKIELA